MTESTPPATMSASPPLRSVSPSPSITPSMAFGACPDLDRSVSDSLTVSSLSSSRSVSGASDAGIVSNRRRGYMRPQGTAFSNSAKNRDSVMSLGSIAHMQYYFARTGLLDGKGAQLARKARDEAAAHDGVRIVSGSDIPGNEDQVVSDSSDDPNTDDASMLPPTVSTYRAKVIEAQPPPDIHVLRRELLVGLSDARKAVEELRNPQPSFDAHEGNNGIESGEQVSESQGWHELQGLHILDVVTLAIRSAKDYYTFHNQPQMLYTIKSEREIRSDLFSALDLLKRMANRNFRGGVRQAECDGLLQWINGIDMLLQRELEDNLRREQRRKQWAWLQGDWTGREREREWQFLSTFSTDTEPLPPWEAATGSEPTAFLAALSSGLRLVHLHNELVKQSCRRFGAIKTYYEDLSKPYRCADNIRYWLKAAELRWEVKLKVPVLDVVYSRGEETWKQFDEAVLKWSQSVRQELSDAWLGGLTAAEPTCEEFPDAQTVDLESISQA